MAKSDILEKIITTKAQEVIAAQVAHPFAVVDAQARAQPPARGFADALRAKIASGKPAVIAEIKKASPSKGVIRESFDPPAIAASYERAGAACLSVLTDKSFFQGDGEFLVAARAACALPALRKEFIVDEYPCLWLQSRGMSRSFLDVVSAKLTTAYHPLVVQNLDVDNAAIQFHLTVANAARIEGCPSYPSSVIEGIADIVRCTSRRKTQGMLWLDSGLYQGMSLLNPGIKYSDSSSGRFWRQDLW